MGGLVSGAGEPVNLRISQGKLNKPIVIHKSTFYATHAIDMSGSQNNIKDIILFFLSKFLDSCQY
jgi:hypothetical protein